MKLNGFMCDRCGRNYERNNIVIESEKAKHRIIGVGLIDVKRNMDRYDLCDDCLNEFIKWVGAPAFATHDSKIFANLGVNIVEGMLDGLNGCPNRNATEEDSDE